MHVGDGPTAGLTLGRSKESTAPVRQNWEHAPTCLTDPRGGEPGAPRSQADGEVRRGWA